MPKLSLSEAWDETRRVLARDGRLFLAVALALFVLPGLILNVSLPVSDPGKFPPAGPWMPIAAVAVLISLVGQLAVLRLAMEPHVSVGEAIVHGLRRLLPYIAGTLCWLLPILIAGSALYGVLIENQTQPSVAAALALIALCILFAFLAVRLMLSSPVAAAENIGPIAILRRSWELSRGNWWRLFVFLLLFGIAALCLIVAVESVAGLLVRSFAADAGPRSIGGLLVSIVSQVVSALLSVFFFVLLARIYAQRSGAEAAQASVPSSGT
jgi:hypothetical protein